MRRVLSFGIVTILLAVAISPGAAQLSRSERRATLQFVNSLRNPDGGFRNTPQPGPSSLAATNACLRAYRYLDARIENRGEVRDFVWRCYDARTGGFADAPGARPEVRTTAIGLMALAELEATRDPRCEQIKRYLVENARSVPDIYIAVAGLAAAEMESPRAAEWIRAYESTRKADGTYGSGLMDTAGAVITLLRLKGELTRRNVLARTLREAQRPDGGFAASGGASDLSTTYRVMRALFMLEEKPRLGALREFVAKCRNADGGYGNQPGQPSTASATYYAAIVLHWAERMERSPGRYLP